MNSLPISQDSLSACPPLSRLTWNAEEEDEEGQSEGHLAAGEIIVVLQGRAVLSLVWCVRQFEGVHTVAIQCIACIRKTPNK